MQSNKKCTHPLIYYVAGHSGGHIVPLIALAERNTCLSNAHALFFITQSNIDQNIAKNERNIGQFITLPIIKFSSKKWWLFSLFFISFVASFCKSVWYLLTVRPQKIISTGSIVAIPVCLAAKLCAIPIELFELNAIPGKAISFLAPLATHIYVCFSSAQKHFSKSKCRITAYPLRSTIYAHAYPRISAKKTILILGGSQGSIYINTAIMQLIEEYPAWAQQFFYIHQTGYPHHKKIQSWYKKHELDSTVFSFIDNLAPYYSSSDLIIGRAGAGTLFEIIACKKPCIVIPLEIHTNTHQQMNAEELQKQYPKKIHILTQMILTQKLSLLKESIERLI